MSGGSALIRERSVAARGLPSTTPSDPRLLDPSMMASERCALARTSISARLEIEPPGSAG
jgi:hypothetical protein